MIFACNRLFGSLGKTRGVGTRASLRSIIIIILLSYFFLARIKTQHPTTNQPTRPHPLLRLQLPDSIGIIHRDLKSDNCLLKNDHLDAKVGDFGTSKLLTQRRSQLQYTGSDETAFADEAVAFSMAMTKGVGTPLWMAPELFVRGTQYGPEVDVYSFGIILWELVREGCAGKACAVSLRGFALDLLLILCDGAGHPT